MIKIALILVTILLPATLTSYSQNSVPRDTLITLQRFSDAFNNGTDYLLTIKADGTVVFKRFANPFVQASDPRSKASKPIESRIPVERVALIIAKFDRAKFFSLRDRYVKEEDGCPAVGTDQGGAEISIIINGKSKTVGHYFGCMISAWHPYPSELTALEDRIDEIVGTKQWLSPEVSNQNQ